MSTNTRTSGGRRERQTHCRDEPNGLPGDHGVAPAPGCHRARWVTALPSSSRHRSDILRTAPLSAARRSSTRSECRATAAHRTPGRGRGTHDGKTSLRGNGEVGVYLGARTGADDAAVPPFANSTDSGGAVLMEGSPT